jgi:hypothetical protein
MTAQPWQNRAACNQTNRPAGVDSTWWDQDAGIPFPAGVRARMYDGPTGAERAGRHATARRICQLVCPVADQCKQAGAGELTGMWAGNLIDEHHAASYSRGATTGRRRPGPRGTCATCGQRAHTPEAHYCKNPACRPVHTTEPDIQHGTDRGARAHRRHGQPVCEPCRRAANLARVERDNRRDKAAAA